MKPLTFAAKRARRAAIILFSSCLIALVGLAAADDRPAAHIDAEGSLHVPDLSAIPPSEFWSPEFKKAYMVTAAASTALGAAPNPPAVHDPKAKWDKFDATVEQSLAGMLSADLKLYPAHVIDTKIAGVHVAVITPQNGVTTENEHRVLINLHGGGFFAGRGLVTGQVESIPIASLGRIKVIAIDYRMVPYFQYPAGSEDVEAVFKELLKQYQPEAIGIFGDSAGAMLTAQSVAWLSAKGLPRPGAVGIFWEAPPSEPMSSARSGDSTMWGVGGILSGSQSKLSALMGPVAWSDLTSYMEGTKSSDWKAYPGSSDAVLAKFPATLLLSGTRSFDMSPMIVAHARFLKLGVDSSLYIMEGGWHGASASAVGTPEARDANAYIVRWFDQHLAR